MWVWGCSGRGGYLVLRSINWNKFKQTTDLQGEDGGGRDGEGWGRSGKSECEDRGEYDNLGQRGRGYNE